MIDPVHPDFTNTPISPQRPRFAYAPVEATASPCVTIVTPFFNTGTIFHETAQSVLQQSLQQWEWLIINDGSTNPEALSVLAHYRSRDPRIRVIDHEVNKGLSAARNTGFHAARAPYVLQLDSDDLVEPTAVEKWVWFLESHPEFAFVKGYSVGFGAEEYIWNKGFHNGDEFLARNLVAPTSLLRTSVHAAVEGYDESNRAGLEDWDFWCRCANGGYWGGTVPEYLDWYRRRPVHKDRWSNWDDGERQEVFRHGLRQKYPRLWNGDFPRIEPRWHLSYENVPSRLPWENQLQKSKPRMLLVVPWLVVGGADKFNLEMITQLAQRGWEVTIVATLNADHVWLPQFARCTPDVFILPHFLRLVDYPRFLRYLIQSRNIDTVIISQCELGYLLLPYLRVQCPTTAFIDLNHIEEESWRSGGYPRMGVEYQGLLDVNVVVSAHLKKWMETHGADERRVAVCYINIDSELWSPASTEQRQTLRAECRMSEAQPVILYVGRICAQKQPLVFAQTMALLAQQDLDFQAIVAGDGPDLESLQTFVKKKGLTQKVSFLGAVSSDRIRQVLQAADIFFLPSEWEGISLAIYEAMACGLPVVGADVGGQRELVTPECGVLIPRGDEQTEAKQYADELARLLRDPHRRHALGQAARTRIEEHFPLAKMGDRIVALLQRAMELHQHEPRPLPTVDVARVSAFHVVEYTRLAGVAEGLWKERGQSLPASVPTYLLDPEHESWRTLAYFAVRRLLLPYYRALVAKNMTWLLQMKSKLKTMLLRGPRSQGAHD